MEARCDYCGEGLGCASDSVAAREYWMTAQGMRICDACLAGQSDGDPFASRLRASLHGIVLDRFRECLVLARDVFSDEQVREVQAEMDQARELHASGERVGALMAANAAWSKAVHMRDRVELHPLIHTAVKVRKPHAEANRRRSDAASEEHTRWQQQAELLWASPQHRGKSASDIARLIDSDRFNTIRRHIHKP